MRLGTVALFVCVLGCGTARPVRDSLGAETGFLAPYAAKRIGRCPNEPFVWVRHTTTNIVIETDPPIHEIAWELTACGETLRFTLDCSMRPKVGNVCHAHDWPTPADDDWPLALEAAAAIRAMPPCPKERSCSTKGQCADDEVRAERVRTDGEASGWRVERCGVRAGIEVRCTRDRPRTCAAQVVATADLGAEPRP